MLDIKFFGKEPEVCIAVVKTKTKGVSVELKGEALDLLTCFSILATALKERIPKQFVDIVYKVDATCLLEKGVAIDMSEFLKQSGK